MFNNSVLFPILDHITVTKFPNNTFAMVSSSTLTIPKPSTSSWLTHDVAGALEVVETHGVTNVAELEGAAGYYYTR